MNQEQRSAEYNRILIEQGFSPTVDADGDITFMFEGGHYLLMVDNDDQFFRLVFPNFWPIDDEPERARAGETALKVSAEVKVAKVFITGNNLSASIEMFVETPAAVAAVLRRSLSALQTAVNLFRKEMLEGAPAH